MITNKKDNFNTTPVLEILTSLTKVDDDLKASLLSFYEGQDIIQSVFNLLADESKEIVRKSIKFFETVIYRSDQEFISNFIKNEYVNNLVSRALN